MPMNNNQIVVIYKKVGNSPTLTKIKNSIEYFKNELKGEIEIIPYENIFIICKKDRERLNPNIFINKSFGKFDSNIRGNVFLVAQKNNEFVSLTKEQAIKYYQFLEKESFSYKHFDENGKYLSSYQLRQRNRKQREIEKQQKQQECKQENDFITIVPVSDSLNSENGNKNCLNISSENTTNSTSSSAISIKPNGSNTPDTSEQTLALILQIQNAILEFIKRYAEPNDSED